MFLRLISLLDTYQISQSEFYNTIGVSKQVWNGWKKRGSIPSTRMEAIKKHYPDFDIEYLTTGQPSAPNGLLQATPTQLQIPILDVEASGGMGSLNGSELVNDHMTVEKSYLGEFGLPTDNLKIITIRGDSMEPELTTGDLVLVHHVPISMEQLHDGMFVVLIDDLLFIKRLQRLPGKKIKVISSNRDAYDPFTIDAVDLSIIGRVVFAWRGKKF